LLKKLHALWLLGTAMLLVVLRRLFLRRDPIRQFEEYYAEEGSLPLAEEESVLLQTPNRCTGCGRCDLDQSGRLVRFMLAGTRSLPDADAGALLVATFSDAEIESAEKACPEQVPISQFVHLVRSHAARKLAIVDALRDGGAR
jgi:ferredoxin